MVNFKNVPAKAKWITSELIELMLQRDNKFKEAKLTGNPDRWTEAKSPRNQVAEACKRAKRDYIKDNITQNQNDPKRFWKEIRKVWGKQ